MFNYYDLLGVPVHATKAEIRAAYKAKAWQYHPDRHFGDQKMEEIFKLLNEAHQTLTDDKARFHYDVMLSYLSETTAETTPEPRYVPPPVYARPKTVAMSSMENLRATAYAFLFAFGIALLIKLSIYFYEDFKAKEYAELLLQRRELFEEIQSKTQSGDLEGSLKGLLELGHFYAEEKDVKQYKEDLLYEIRKRGDNHLKAAEYEQALSMYQLLKDDPISASTYFMKNMAMAYKGAGDIKSAIDIYRTLHLYGYESMDFYWEMGQLYEEGLEDYEQALRYYQIGASMAVSSYEQSIGKAYSIVINADLVPKKHYDVYMKVAEMHYASQHYTEAINSISWTKEIWPDSIFQYQIEAKSRQQLGQIEEMNAVIAFAKTLNPDFTVEQ
ncbi:DnaJ domain-containing protein [Reichenbachiella agarivorans]|uniref:DnaJ domain-containing protein n=1 Tax=Reichenbachiella agarivorans TaxID=2979464 RepID=A0ABY6CTT9_9BACT|nr:DnaJ domain-containing protein [Reichenbachiella agarivorans]UXP33935.1 DnaJ domain-containing protein [Reichenbachiella agarivorans]